MSTQNEYYIENHELYNLFHQLRKDGRWQRFLFQVSDAERQINDSLAELARESLKLDQEEWKRYDSVRQELTIILDQYKDTVFEIREATNIEKICQTACSLPGMTPERLVSSSLDTDMLTVEGYRQYIKDCKAVLDSIDIESTSARLAVLFERMASLEKKSAELESKLSEYCELTSCCEDTCCTGMSIPPMPTVYKCPPETRKLFGDDLTEKVDVLVFEFPMRDCLLKYKALFEDVNATLKTCETCESKYHIALDGAVYWHCGKDHEQTIFHRTSLGYDGIAVTMLEFIKLVSEYTQALEQKGGRISASLIRP